MYEWALGDQLRHVYEVLMNPGTDKLTSHNHCDPMCIHEQNQFLESLCELGQEP